MYKKFHKRRLRNAIRGFNFLKSKENLGLVRGIHAKLANARLRINGVIFLNSFVGKKYCHNEEIARQYLMENLISSNFDKAILRSIGGNSDLIYPLPLNWINELKKCGLSVNVTLSTVLWYLYVFKKTINATLLFLRIILIGVANTIKGENKFPHNQYIYIFGLSTKNLPTINSSDTPYDFCSWYISLRRWENTNKDIYHDVNTGVRSFKNIQVLPGPHPYFLLMRFSELIKFTCIGFFLIFSALLNLILSFWWPGLMSAEQIKLLAMAIIPDKRLAAEYLFPFSYSLYRPLWTYRAEISGAKITCFFYSTFEHPSMSITVDDPLRSILKLASWPNYLVWDNYQDNMLKEELSCSYSTEIIGAIPFSNDGSLVLEDLPSKCIAVFDIEFYRLSAHFPISTYADFYCAHPDFAERFFMDIQIVLQEFSLSMAFKPKRPSKLRSRKSYLSLLKKLDKEKNTILIHPDVSPLKLINECIGVISMPFTSTALYYQGHNNRSIYYDPTSWFQKDDKAAHGILLISGIDELRAWVKDYF